MKASKYLLTLFFLYGFAVSCGKKEVETVTPEERILFEKSCNLIKELTVQLQNAKDTAAYDSIIELFEKKLTDINFAVSPETDLKMTEQENDSLFKLMQNFYLTKANKKKNLGMITTDSVDMSGAK